VHFGVLSMTRNRTCSSEESCFSSENHESALSEEGERRVRELLEHHFFDGTIRQSQPVQPSGTHARMFVLPTIHWNTNHRS